MRFFYGLVLLLLLASCAAQKNITKEKNTSDFHVYLLMGQSNMAGRGKVAAIDTLIHPRVFMLDKTMTWVPAKDPVHFDKKVAGTGLGLTFGKVMANEYPDKEIGLVPCAVGGSSIDSWFRDSLHYQTKSYPYNDMIARAKKAMEEGDIKGILWHQGESDAGSEERIKAYEQKFRAMLDSMKNDLKIRDVPIVLGEIGYFQYSKKPRAKSMNDTFAKIAQSNKHIALVSAEGLTHKGDSTHFNSDSYHALGVRYANKMIELQNAIK